MNAFDEAMLLPGATLDNVNTSGFHGPEPDPDPDPCRLCRGRGDLEDPEHGGDFTCWQCDGTGEQPHPDEEPADPNVCVHCDHQRAFHFDQHEGVCFGPDCDCSSFREQWAVPA